MWEMLRMMVDDFEKFGDPHPSVAEPQDGGLTPSQVRWILSLTPEQRLKIHDGFLELSKALREAGGGVRRAPARAHEEGAAPWRRCSGASVSPPARAVFCVVCCYFCVD